MKHPILTRTANIICFVTVVLMSSISCSSDDGTTNMKEEEKETIIGYTDVEFALEGNTEGGRWFASVSGKVYKEAELTQVTGATVDLVSVSNSAFIAFSSPDDSNNSITVPGATRTKTQHENVTMTATAFDAIKDDSALKNITITHDTESIGISGFEGKIILFENAKGKKGAIRLKAINAKRLLVDIKVMK